MLEQSVSIAERRATLEQCYVALPEYASAAFWFTIEANETPLEVLVRCFRVAHLYEDSSSQDRLFTIIVRRTQGITEYWAKTVLGALQVSEDEHAVMVGDLCADFYECLLRALLDDKRHFWEEHFLHCLRLERKHVYKAFMMREGYWHDKQVKRSNRIPRAVVLRLDMLYQQNYGDGDNRYTRDIEDERAQRQFSTVEHTELLEVIQRLPPKLKTVVLLLYWEGLSEKETATLLRITDRTVRNRIKQALRVLQTMLYDEGETYEAKV